MVAEPGKRILVVDTDPQMGRLLHPILSARGYEAIIAADGQTALDHTLSWRPHVVLLELLLPGLPGIEFCRRVRGWSYVPIIVLSNTASESVKVSLLDAGADDYVTKPFGTEELLARIRVALRHRARVDGAEEPVLTFGELSIDRARRIVTTRGHEVHLTPTEYDLLLILSGHAGTVLSHRTLLQQVWGPTYEQDLPTLRVFITQLRRKIEPDPSQPTFILTEPGIGYRFHG